MTKKEELGVKESSMILDNTEALIFNAKFKNDLQSDYYDEF